MKNLFKFLKSVATLKHTNADLYLPTVAVGPAALVAAYLVGFQGFSLEEIEYLLKVAGSVWGGAYFVIGKIQDRQSQKAMQIKLNETGVLPVLLKEDGKAREKTLDAMDQVAEVAAHAVENEPSIQPAQATRKTIYRQPQAPRGGRNHH